MSWGSKEWANEQLRFAIASLDETVEGWGCSWKGRLQIALIVKRRLVEAGFWWQSKTLNHHIHRFQKVHRKEIVGLRRVVQ